MSYTDKIEVMIKRLFPQTQNIKEVVNIIEKHRMKFGLNTDLRLKHFLAQVREEVGPNFRVMRESLNYSPSALISTFKVFRDNPSLANKYGRIAGQNANQEMIANYAYANRLGNGNVETGDGWKYRGAGCLQITGKANFAEVQERCLKYAGKEFDPDTLEGFIVVGMSYWIWRDCYRAADTDDIDKVTAIINRYTNSYGSRKEHYNKIRHLV